MEFLEESRLLDLLEPLDFLLELEFFLLDLLLDFVGVDDLTSRTGSIFSAWINSSINSAFSESALTDSALTDS